MSLSQLTALSGVLAGVVVLLAAAVTVLALRLRRLAAEQRIALDGVEVDVVATLARQRRRLEELAAEIAAVRAHSEGVASDLTRTLSRVGVVRYDAFDDIGGHQSFSAALVDEHGDGVVVTSITGRSDGRTYLKSLTAWDSVQLLSDEERAAVVAARSERRSEQVAEQGKRSWRQREGSTS